MNIDKEYYNLGVVGSRSIRDQGYVWSCIEEVIRLVGEKPRCIVSGGAIGVDGYAAQYAKEHEIFLIEHYPDYRKHGSSAPFIRNEKIVKDSAVLVAVWDGESNGTLNSINIAKKLGIPTNIFVYGQLRFNI